MARYIDADALIASLNDWRKNWEESEDSYEKTWTLTAIDFMKSLVDKKKTAYDVEAVVAELEASAEGAKDSKDLSKWSAYKQAISIVRGKE